MRDSLELDVSQPISALNKLQEKTRLARNEQYNLTKAFKAFERASGGNMPASMKASQNAARGLYNGLNNDLRVINQLKAIGPSAFTVMASAMGTAQSGAANVKKEVSGTTNEVKGLKNAAAGAGSELGKIGSTLSSLVTVGAITAGANILMNAYKTTAQYAAQMFNYTTTANDNIIGMQARTALGNGSYSAGEPYIDKIFSHAISTRSSYETYGESVGRLNAMARKEFVGGTDQIIDFVDTLQKTFKISGVDPISQHAGTYQLVQAMASGRLQGDELRSISENAPMLRNYIAKYFGIKSGEVKQYGKEGKITPDVIIKALQMAKPEVEGIYKEMPKSFADIKTELSNRTAEALRPLGKKITTFFNSKSMQGFLDKVPQYITQFEKLGAVIGEKLIKKLGFNSLDDALKNSDEIVDKSLGIAKDWLDFLVDVTPSLDDAARAMKVFTKVIKTIAKVITTLAGGIGGVLVTLLGILGARGVGKLTGGIINSLPGASAAAAVAEETGGAVAVRGAATTAAIGSTVQAGVLGGAAGYVGGTLLGKAFGNGNESATSIGGAIGGAAGAALGSLAGPIGTAIGTAAGTLLGSIIGESNAEYNKDKKVADFAGSYAPRYSNYVAKTNPNKRGLHQNTGRAMNNTREMNTRAIAYQANDYADNTYDMGSMKKAIEGYTQLTTIYSQLGDKTSAATAQQRANQVQLDLDTQSAIMNADSLSTALQAAQASPITFAPQITALQNLQGVLGKGGPAASKFQAGIQSGMSAAAAAAATHSNVIIGAVQAAIDALAALNTYQLNVQRQNAQASGNSTKELQYEKYLSRATGKGSSADWAVTRQVAKPTVSKYSGGSGGSGGGGGTGRSGGGGSTVKKIIDPVKIAEEDIKYLRDIARQKYINKYVTMSPVVTFNATISEKVDANEVMKQMENAAANAWASALS